MPILVRDCDNNDIIDEVREKTAHAARLSLRALVIHPGALGDCLLTLPLARFLKEALGHGGVELMARTDYVGFYPGRTCIDAVRSIDSVEMFRLFTKADDFHVGDHDPLITTFMDYALIVSFLGTANSDFEANLTYTVHCHRSADVIILPLKPSEPSEQHVADYYCEEVTHQCALLPDWQRRPAKDTTLVTPTAADQTRGRAVLSQVGVVSSSPLVVLHPGSGGREKCWHIGNYLAIAQAMKNQGWAAAFVLGPVEQERLGRAQIESLVACSPVIENLELSDVVAVLSCAQAFVGNDSGISHLAAAMGLRTCAVFGPSCSAMYQPVGPSVQVFNAELTGFTDQVSAEVQGQVLGSLLR
jgi:heptosyltransferase-3